MTLMVVSMVSGIYIIVVVYHRSTNGSTNHQISDSFQQFYLLSMIYCCPQHHVNSNQPVATVEGGSVKQCVVRVCI